MDESIAKRTPIAIRFEKFARVDGETGCWLWTGAKTTGGYGTINEGGRKGRPLLAHRVAHELFRGPILDGLQIDHLCKVRHCVNPDHLEAVTCAENIRRSGVAKAARARHRAKTHCKNGHPLSGENLDPYQLKIGYRQCVICNRAAKARYRARIREEAQRSGKGMNIG